MTMAEQESAVVSGNNPIQPGYDFSKVTRVKGLGTLTYDRDYRTYWNRYGEPSVLPADPVQLMILMEQGWTLFEPTHPLEKPTELIGAADPSVGETERINRGGGRTVITSTAPTATYYSPNGDVLEGLPADPANMKEYFALGLSLTPPIKALGKSVKKPEPVAVDTD